MPALRPPGLGAAASPATRPRRSSRSSLYLRDMDYERAVETAPPGWQRFGVKALARLPEEVRRHELGWIPVAERRLVEAGDPAAIDRLRRAFFWTFIYHLQPKLWDALAKVEPI